MPRKIKTYIVPVVVHCRFACEMRVHASSKANAIKAAKNGDGATVGECYDWDRFIEDRYEIGDWQRIKEEKAP